MTHWHILFNWLIFLKNKPFWHIVIKKSQTEKTLLNRIKELRKSRKLTQQELAAKVGISYTHLGRIENGGRGLDLEYIPAFASALGVKPYELLPLEWQPSGSSYNSEDLASIITLVETQLQEMRVIMSPEYKAKLIVLLLDIAREQPANENLAEKISDTINLYTRVISA